jgi:hypothetical protein
MVINVLNLSPVTKRCKGTILASCELLLEELKVLSLDWVDSAKDVPVHERGTWRGSARSFVGPSVVKVDKLHQVSVSYKISDWVNSLGPSRKIIVPLKTLEECVDNLNLSLSKVSSCTGVGEKDTNSSFKNIKSSNCSCSAVIR